MGLLMDTLMNVIAVEGYLTSEVNISFDDVKSSSIARFYIKNPCQIGQNKYGNDFYIIVYGKKAEECKKYLSLGKKCSVTGKVSTWVKNDKRGKTQPGITIIASEVHFKKDEKESIDTL